MISAFRTVIIGNERKASVFRHLLEGSEDFQYSGFYDPDDSANADILGKLLFTKELQNSGDAFIFDRQIRHIDVELLENLTKMGKHILLDGFLIHDLPTIVKLHSLQQESRNCIQVANVLYNKPLFTTASQYMRKPRFIRIEKNCSAPKPGEFNTWFYNNLSQEMDIAIRLADSGIRNISARPLFLFGNSPDLLNIHMEFDNDAICHITAGRAIENGIHKFRVFQQDRLFHLDFSENMLVEYRPANADDQLSILPMDIVEGKPEFIEIPRAIMPFDSWKMELRNFSENITKKLSPLSSLENMETLNAATQWVQERVQRRYAAV